MHEGKSTSASLLNSLLYMHTGAITHFVLGVSCGHVLLAVLKLAATPSFLCLHVIALTTSMSHSLCLSPLHLPCHYALPSEGPAAGCSRNEVPMSLPVLSATSQEPPLPCPPAESVSHLPAPAGSTAVRGRCRPCASHGLVCLPHGSEAPVPLGRKLRKHVE